MTQCERLKSYLTEHDAIDPMTAWNALGIYRLGARIFDLKASGIKIISDTVSVKNRFGEECRVASYSISLMQRLDYFEFERTTLKMPEQVARYNELTAKIANLRTKVERMAVKS